LRAKDLAVPANVGPSSNGSDSNFTLGVDSVTVVIDKIPPVSGLILPAPGALRYTNSLPTISGTSFDSISKITSAGQVKVSIHELSPNSDWWAGAATFTATSEQFYAVSALQATNSTWTLNTPPFQHGFTYLIRAQATDNVVPTGNSESLIGLSSATFVYDIRYPTATVTSPANGAIISQISQIAGNTVEDFVMSQVWITIKDNTAGLWWDQGTSAFSRTDPSKLFYLATQQSPNWATWSWPFGSSALTTGRSYTIQVYGIDAAGNQQPASSSGFTWDKTDPTSVVTLPMDGAFIGTSGLTVISGNCR